MIKRDSKSLSIQLLVIVFRFERANTIKYSCNILRSMVCISTFNRLYLIPLMKAPMSDSGIASTERRTRFHLLSVCV